ncbi:hypothetical protein DENIS_0605 [Desulfonema ishimotonii]|uniref:Uncharacterized protein n=1 Tax=Desulfonema ishimotonii TaxID=45657 RepID=A0A401FRS2_9BACT|nr:hypothetical protein [Desulfonema ishimotonii]GBC59664.1 hypothetical protein DENIS_0605 [Desulfonema ishimotonii]
MHERINKNGWIWVVIQDPEKGAQIVGQHYADDNISFIPAFVEKDEALMCYNSLTLEDGIKYEVQAIHYEDLISHAAQNSFQIFLLDGKGKLLDQITP